MKTVSNSNNKAFQERYKNLNAEQRRAVDTIEGPLLVVAGPGSGKTELLSLRTANILLQAQVSPHNILLLTFTDSGAQAMRERLVSIIGDAAYRVGIYTFHSFASDVIGRYGEYFFEGARFSPVSDLDQSAVMDSILDTLSKRNPLSSKHPEQGFVFKRDILQCISGLKKGNLSPSEFRELVQDNVAVYAKIHSVANELLGEIAGKRKFEVVRDGYLHLYEALQDLQKEEESPVLAYMTATLGMELQMSGDTGEYKNLNAWRDDLFTNGGDGKILRDSRPEKIEKWLALADVYEIYNAEMHKRGLYDFDDMIFTVSRELEANSSLRNELEEKYQYIMIDEFQDTNAVQFALVKALTMSPINEGMPNVMVVGDDDQAIYKFQGAELDNMYAFRREYPRAELVTLLHNYRSTQDILDKSREVIVKIPDRLETRYGGEINKKIVASNEDLLERVQGKSQIVEKSFADPRIEMEYIATSIKELLAQGVEPSEVAVLSRSHNNLREIAKVMSEFGVPFAYEKKENVFEKEPIRQLVTIALFAVDALSRPRDEMLPEILSYPFWGIDRVAIWQIAVEARRGTTEVNEFGQTVVRRGEWLECMLASKDNKIQGVAKLLIELSSDVETMPLEHILDKIINASPYRQYYFDRENFEHNKAQYLEFLFALQTLVGALREYKQGSILRAKDLKEFVDIYTGNTGLTLSIRSPFATSDKAVVLQTAHKSKGLEYEYVFIMNSDNEEWGNAGRRNLIGLPIETKLLPDADTIDDRIRLYYVAMTRSKHTLVITHHKNKFAPLVGAGGETVERYTAKVEEIKEESLRLLSLTQPQPLIKDEKVLLKHLLENYTMSATHLKNFLDFSKVGPSKFIEQNLLHFPEAKSGSSVYGTAMHEAVQVIYSYYKKTGTMPTESEAQIFFENALARGALTMADTHKYLSAGKECIALYLRHLKEKGIRDTDVIERNFAGEGVVFDGVRATGKIDRMEFDGETIVVTDFKTGKSFDDWEVKDSNDAIKLHFFKYQLAYYVLLIRNSASYSRYSVPKGIISFLEADRDKVVHELLLDIDENLIERVRKLASVVYKKIMDLDLPDTSRYMIKPDGTIKTEPTLKDIEQFEEDLLAGNI